MKEKNKKEKKKRTGKILLLTFGLLIVLALVGVFGIYPAYAYFAHGENLYAPTEEPPAIAEQENVDFNSENGALYVNDEVIVVARAGVDQKEIEALAEEYQATVSAAMEDIGFYKFRFAGVQTYSALDMKLKRLREEPEVEDAYFNTVFEMTGDTAEEPPVTPVYPRDQWNDDDWATDAPRGANWGAEAIHAPDAWAYQDSIGSVKIGLIDTMVNTEHPDLQGIQAMLTLTDETTTTYSVTSADYAPEDHGCHVAGIMGATWNEEGIAGIAGSKARLYYSAAYYIRDGSIYYDYYDAFNYLAAIRALVNAGVKVINISQNTDRLIGFAASRGNQNAIDYLTQNAEIAGKGISRLVDAGKEFVLCVAAGNSNNLTYYKSSNAVYGYTTTPPLNPFNCGEQGDSLAKYNNFLNLITDEAAMDRIIVVGSVGIDEEKSSRYETRYRYSAFSNVGDRVDVVAPGERIYSAFATGYDYNSGTSMATPHVSGVAGLVFGANPNLTGAEVKRIVLSSTYGRFYYTGGYSGMVDAAVATKFALESRTHSVGAVIKAEASDGLDVCFVVDTTGSMSDDISNAQENMSRILENLSAKSEEFRVALVDYRDFADRGNSDDYPAKVQLEFTDDTEAITDAIFALDLGYGGDDPETVYSGLMTALELDWREHAAKVIILLGDAPPLDPEPYTDYTLSNVLFALYHADLMIDADHSDERVLGDASESLINVYSIGTDASSDAIDYFEQISAATGGAFTGVDSAADVSDAIINSIDRIDLIPTKNVSVAFGDSCADETAEFYQDGEFIFSLTLDEDGKALLENMPVGEYGWAIPRLRASGTMEVREKGRTAQLDYDKQSLADRIVAFCRRYAVWLIVGVSALLLLAIVLLTVLLRRKHRKQRQPEPPAEPNVSPPAQHYCRHCGSVLPDGAAFCANCGAKR